ncbi:phage tail tape measure protein [Lysinibacillus sphaericus]|uniref:phage tail tape measure protein n=1 Tax=Lysinibacillus sphaericus TaxID=1421 RepID=UPI003D052DE1
MASIGSLEVSLSLNASNFNGTIAQVDRNLKAMGAELQALKSKGSEYEKSIEGIAQKKGILARQTEAASLKLQEQRRIYDEYVASGEKTEAQIERQAAAVNRAQAQYNNLERQLAEVTEQLRIQSSQWTQAGQRMQEVGGKLTAVGNSMKNIGRNMSMYITAPLATLGAGIVKIGMDFDSQMSKVSAVSGATGADFDALRVKAQDLGATTKFTATQVAEGMEYLALAGYNTNQILSATNGVLNLAAAGAMDLGMAADITTDVMSAFGMQAKEAGHAADIFAYAQANANTNVEQAGEAMKYLAPMANQMGWSMEEATAAVMKLADNGLKGSIAGQAFASSLGRLAKPTKQMRKTLDELNISFFDSNDNMKSLPDIIGHLEDKFTGLTMKQKSAALTTLFGAEAYKHWAILLESGSDTLAQYTKELENSDGTAQRMADTMVDNLAGSMLMLKSALEGLAIQFSDLIKDDIRALADWLTKMTGKFAELSDGTKKTILVVGGLAAAIGPLVLIGGALISSAGTIITAMGSLALSLGVAGGATTAFGAALAVVTGPIGLTVAAVAALGVGAVIVAKEVSKASLEVKSFKNNVSESTAKAVGSFLGLSDKATVALNQLAWSGKEVTGEMATKMIETYKQMGEQVLTEMQSDHAKELSEMQKHFAKSDALTKEQEQAIIERVQASHKAKETMTAEGNARIAKIWRLAADEHRQITDDEYQEISAIQENMKKTAIKYMSESEVEQKVILENLKNEASKITTEQAAEVVRNSLKQKDGVIKEAEKQYNDIYKWAIRQRDETGAMSAEEAQAVIDDAERKRDETVKSAKDMHTKVVTEAQKQAEEHVNKVDWETGEILSKWGVFKAKHAGIWNAVESQISNITDSIKEISTKAYDFIKSKIGDALKEVVTFSKEQLDKLKEFWNENGKAIIGIVQLYFGQIKANIEAVMKIIKGVFEVVWPMITGVFKIAWNTIKLTVGNTLDLILGVIQTVMKVIQGDWKGAWETIKQTAVDIMDNVTEYFRNVDLLQIGKDIIQGLIDGIGSMVDGVKTSASYMMDQINEAFGEKFEALKTSIIDWFTSIPGVIESKLSEWGTAISNWFTSLPANTAAKLDEWWIAISDWFSSVPEKIFAKLSEWGLAILEWSNQQNEENKRQFGEWWNAIAEWFSSIPEKITSKLGEWGTTIKDWFTSIPEEIASKLSEWWDTISNWFTEAYEGITSKIGEWGTAIGNWFSEMPSNIGDWLSEWWTKISTWFSEIPEKITAKFEEWWEAIKNWFTSVPDKPEIKNMGKNMIDKVAEGNKEKKPELLDKLGKIIVDVALGAVAVAGVALLAAGREIIKRLIDGIQESKKTLEAKVTEIKELIENKIKEVNLLQIGRDIVNGLIKGIGEKFEGVRQKVEELASKLPQWARDKLGIKSPSRVMMEVGKWTGEGLAVGIESTQDRNESAMKELGQLLINATKTSQDEVTKIADEAEKQRTKIQDEAAKKKLEIQKKLGVDLQKANNTIRAKKKGATANDTIKVQQLKETANAKLIKLEQDTQDKLKKINDKAWADMVKKEESMAAERLTLIKRYIDDKKSTEELSLIDEANILEQSLNLFKEGTKERVELQKAYQKTIGQIKKEEDSINKEYYDNVKKLNDEYTKEEERLTKVYEDEFDKRRNAYYSFAGIFDEVVQRDVSGSALITALQSQVTAFEDWQKNIAELSSKGINEGLLAELQAMGPKAGAEIAALNTLTEEQLATYTEVWKTKNEQARIQTETELKGLKQNTEQQISDLQRKTADQLRVYQDQWRTSMIALKGNVKTEMAEMPNIGVFAVSGLIDGMMSKQGDLLNAASSLAAIVASAFAAALDIHSPSRVMRGYGINIGEGLILGINEMVGKVAGATKRLAKAVSVDGMNQNTSGNTSPSTTTTTENNYNLTVTSPKPLDPYETARLSKNGWKEIALQI